MPRYEDTDRVYHGVQSSHIGPPSQLFVEQAEEGPTERETVTAIRELREPRDGGFEWGYNGSGTSQAAAAILTDALDEASDAFSSPTSANDTYQRLREDFCEDVLMHMCDEFRLRRGAVLRWVRGWYAERGDYDLPPAVADLPPIDSGRYSRW